MLIIYHVGSVRRLFLQKKAELGFTDVSKGSNGVHMSAGPLEGMVEFIRFFSDHENSIFFGKKN